MDCFIIEEVIGRAKRRPSTIVVVVAALGAMLSTVALIAETVFHTSIDPTESSFTVTLHNDTPVTVVLKQCDSDCSSFHERHRLEPGGSVRVDSSSDSAANWWSVTNSTGATLGCLLLRYDHKVEGLVVNVSARTTCPEAADAAGSTVVGNVVCVALALLAGCIALTSVVFATMASYRWARCRGLSDHRVALVTTGAGFAMFLGGWLVFDVYVLVRQGARIIHPPAASVTDPVG